MPWWRFGAKCRRRRRCCMALRTPCRSDAWTTCARQNNWISRGGASDSAKMGAFASGRFLSTVYIRFTTQASHGLQRAPLLERLIARANPFEPAGDWRGEAFRVIAEERE